MSLTTKEGSARLSRTVIRHDWLLRALIALIACMASLWIELLPSNELLRGDEAIRDIFTKMGSSDRTETRLTLVDIGETALTDIGPWPWPRDRLADLAETLLEHYKAKIIAFDIVFPEASDETGDRRLSALAAKKKLVLAQILDYTEREPPLKQGILVGGEKASPEQKTPPAYGFVANHIGLAKSACVGNIGYAPDQDGILRHLPANTEYQGRVYAHLAPMLLDCASNQEHAYNQLIRTDRSGLWRIPYRNKLTSYTVVPAEDVLNRSAPRDLFEGRYLLVGSSALGLGDRVSTPLVPLGSGLLVHAESLSALLDLAEGAQRPAWSGQILSIGWAIVTILAASILLSRLSPLLNISLLLSLGVLWLSLAYIGVRENAEGSILAPLAAYLVMLTVAIPYEWWRSLRTTRRLFDVFSHYVAMPVLNELLRQGANYSLTPTLRKITVLVADMEGYTRATSALSLDAAATLTKDFLDCLTRPVLARHGTLDKYTGDGLVAFWGAPLPCPHQADEAISAALEILHEVSELNRRRGESGGFPVRVRIGIESGEALVGDLGTSFRSTYTAVGDCINFASRLEAEARNLHVQVVIGPIANQLIKRHKTVALGRHPLRGTSTEIDLFALENEKEEFPG